LKNGGLNHGETVVRPTVVQKCNCHWSLNTPLQPQPHTSINGTADLQKKKRLLPPQFSRLHKHFFEMLTLIKMQGVKPQKYAPKRRSVFVTCSVRISAGTSATLRDVPWFSIVPQSIPWKYLEMTANLRPGLLKFITMQSSQNRHSIYWLRHWQRIKINLPRHQDEPGNSTTVIPSENSHKT